MICNSCKSVYSPSTEELAKVETLAGFCDKCGTEPRLKRFAIALIEGAVAGVLIIELLLLLALVGGWRKALIPPLAVVIVCVLVYVIASRTEVVRYRSKEQRDEQTRGHRVAGWAIGLIIGMSALVGFTAIQ